MGEPGEIPARAAGKPSAGAHPGQAGQSRQTERSRPSVSGPRGPEIGAGKPCALARRRGGSPPAEQAGAKMKRKQIFLVFGALAILALGVIAWSLLGQQSTGLA